MNNQVLYAVVVFKNTSLDLVNKIYQRTTKVGLIFLISYYVSLKAIFDAERL